MNNIELYKNIINGKQMSLSVSKYKKEIRDCTIFKGKEFAFIGISLGNSYFKEDRLELIFRAFSKNFRRVAILLVDELSIHNYKAMGYSKKKIKKKLRQNSNVARNRILRCMDNTNEIYSKDNIEFYKWNDIEKSHLYKNKLSEITKLYENNIDFKNKINDVTKDVIEKYLKEKSTEFFISESKWYFLKEISFGCCINDFFSENEILNCYYQDFRFYREFFESELIPSSKFKKQDFLIYNCLLG